MSAPILVFVLYVASCVAAYALFIHAERFCHAVRREDVHFFAGLSLLGPIALVVAVIGWHINRSVRGTGEIIYPRYSQKTGGRL